MNITELAVSKSPRTMDTVTAVASRTDTARRPWSKEVSPARMYLTERNTAINVRMDIGRNSLLPARRRTVNTSLSSNSRFSSRELCSGASASDFS